MNYQCEDCYKRRTIDAGRKGNEPGERLHSTEKNHRKVNADGKGG